MPPHIYKKNIGSLVVKLKAPAGQASPAPPIGPALGSKGVKAMDFAKEFNARTVKYEPGIPIPCSILINGDKTFTFEIKSPPTSWLIFKAAGIEKGSGFPKSGAPIGKIGVKAIYEIAKIKQSVCMHQKFC